MKIYFVLLIIILLNSNSLFAQVDEAAVAIDSTYADLSDVADAVYPVGDNAYTTTNSYSMPDDELAKYSFKKGTPIFIIVNVEHSNPNDSLLAIRELRELQKNFEYLKADFLPLHRNAVLTFENRNNFELRLDDYNTQYKSVIFWDGKTDSDIYQVEPIFKSSEAYSEQLGMNKTSSYVDEFFKKKEELSQFKNEAINQQSAAVSKKYISNLFLSEVYFLKNEEHFFQLDFKGVKKLTVNSNVKKFKNPFHEADFDTNGNPIKMILHSDDIDGKKMNLSFTYLSESLKKIVSTYADDHSDYRNEQKFLYQSGNLYEVFYDDSSFTKHYLNENGFLLNHSYYFDESRYFIIEDELTQKGKTLSYRDYGNLNNREYTLNSLTDYFPVKVNVRNEFFYEIKRISKNEFQIKSDDSSTRIYLDEKGKISKVILENIELDGESKPKDLIFEYVYEYY